MQAQVQDPPPAGADPVSGPDHGGRGPGGGVPRVVNYGLVLRIARRLLAGEGLTRTGLAGACRMSSSRCTMYLNWMSERGYVAGSGRHVRLTAIGALFVEISSRYGA